MVSEVSGLKLSPHRFILSISALHANTLISIRFCSGQPGSHDISQAKESTEQLCGAREWAVIGRLSSAVMMLYSSWCRPLARGRAGLKKILFTSAWDLKLSKSGYMQKCIATLMTSTFTVYMRAGWVKGQFTQNWKRPSFNVNGAFYVLQQMGQWTIDFFFFTYIWSRWLSNQHFWDN